MLRLGIVGTGWINREFADAAIQSGKYEITAVLSRKRETAVSFAKEFGSSQTKLFSDLQEFMREPGFDAVYIASPNSLHFAQSKLALECGKHVLVEKPAVSNPMELAHLISLAAEKNLYYIEAIRNVYEKNFQKIKELVVAPEEVTGANFTYMKYSSRYHLVLEGQEPSVFSLQYSGGALTDLGIYLVYAALELFGKPLDGTYICDKIITGVDGTGIIILNYPAFRVCCQVGKIGDSFLPCEIYTKKGTVLLDGIQSVSDIKIWKRDAKTAEKVLSSALGNPLAEEAAVFAQWISEFPSPQVCSEYQYATLRTKMAHELLFQLRRRAGISFPADRLTSVL